MKLVIFASTTLFEDICPFKRSTGTSYYDNFLNDKDLKYMQKSKNRTGEIVMMSPAEYYEECATNIFEGSSVTSLKLQRGSNSELIQQYEEDMKNGDKFPLCYLNYPDHAQEGLHRMMAAGNVYGWDTKFPVLVVYSINALVDDLNSIWRYWCDAVYEAEEYAYYEDTWEKDIVEQIESELEHSTQEYHKVIIVNRRDKDECERLGMDYGIEVVLEEFQDIMNPVTIFEPERLKSREADEYDFDFDLDDLDDLDLDFDN